MRFSSISYRIFQRNHGVLREHREKIKKSLLLLLETFIAVREKRGIDEKALQCLRSRNIPDKGYNKYVRAFGYNG